MTVIAFPLPEVPESRRKHRNGTLVYNKNHIGQRGVVLSTFFKMNGVIYTMVENPNGPWYCSEQVNWERDDALLARKASEKVLHTPA